MSKTNDGGPAFPCNVTHSSGGDGFTTEYGVSLRDYFAAAALTGLLARPELNSEADADVVAFQYADAMLRERSK